MALPTIPRKVVILVINIQAPLMGIVARLTLPMPTRTFSFPAPDRIRQTGKQSVGCSAWNGRLRWTCFIRFVLIIFFAVFTYHLMLFYICKVNCRDYWFVLKIKKLNWKDLNLFILLLHNSCKGIWKENSV